MSDSEFWALTLKQFNLLWERHKQKQSAELFNSALICSVIANVHRGKGKAYEPADFMPKERKKKKKMSIAEMVEALKAVTARAGGEIKC